MLKISEILVEYRDKPLGLDLEKPRFSWLLESDENSTEQVSYSLKVSNRDETVWDSGIIHSDQSVLVAYAGKKLNPITYYNVILVVTDNYGNTASERTSFETGIMGNFTADWITHGLPEDKTACPVFKREFSTANRIEKARLYITALGIYEAQLNGEKVSDTFFDPGWTSYNKRLQYQTFDITNKIDRYNKISVTLANGWYKGNLAFKDHYNIFGDRTALLMEIHIDYEDGSSDVIKSDTEFMWGTGTIRYSELYHGETQDRNLTYDEAGYAALHEYSKDMIVSQEGHPVRIIEKLDALELIETPAGEKVIDFGQNLTGFVEIDCDYAKGTKIVLKHAEVLDKDGNFYIENLRAAKCTDRFICSGNKETLRPVFTFHGFRYISIEGLEEIDINKFKACVLHTDMKETGFFECSDELVSKLQKNIKWGQRGNFLDIPTDCPQRDERLGWTGDAQVFCGTAAYNYDVALFFRKWLHDLKVEQTKSGIVPIVIPDVMTKDGNEPRCSTAWGDAATIIPYEMYKRYSDKLFLEEQYESMSAWVEYIARQAGNSLLWTTGRHFGDWLALDKEEIFVNNKKMGSSTGATDKHFIANAYFAHSTELLAKSAMVLDYKNDIEKYKKLHEKIINAFRNEYVTTNGRLVCESQTAMVLALKFNLIEEKHREALIERLAANIRNHKNHMVTGFVGVSMLCRVLSENGHHELAGKLLLQKDYPSWLYPITMGATTIWERWNGIKPDGTFETPKMNSFNHYAYGAIGDWMYKYLLGINYTEPGYKSIEIKPMPIDGIESAAGSYESPFGRISASWEIENEVFVLDVEIPVNCTARIVIPGKKSEISVGSGTYNFTEKIKDS